MSNSRGRHLSADWKSPEQPPREAAFGRTKDRKGRSSTQRGHEEGVGIGDRPFSSSLASSAFLGVLCEKLLRVPHDHVRDPRPPPVARDAGIQGLRKRVPGLVLVYKLALGLLDERRGGASPFRGRGRDMSRMREEHPFRMGVTLRIAADSVADRSAIL